MAQSAGRLTAFILAALFAQATGASEIAMGDGSAAPGASGVEVVVTFTRTDAEEVSGIQFDIVYDETVLSVSDVVAGAAASDAGKQVASSQVEDGRTAVVISGITTTFPIQTGALAIVTFAVAADAIETVYTIEMADVILSDEIGRRVSATVTDGSFTVSESGTEGDGEGGPIISCYASGPGETGDYAVVDFALLIVFLVWLLPNCGGTNYKGTGIRRSTRRYVG